MAFAALGLGLALVVGVGLFGVTMGQIRCGEAATALARAAAREDLAGVADIIAGLPQAVSFEQRDQGEFVVVTVSMDLEPWGDWFPGITVHATASALDEGRLR